MKIRTGFVSNSSSSSYTCDVCKNTKEGQDLCLSEAEMHQCINGHVFCDCHMKEPTPENADEHEFRYDTPGAYCPICRLDVILDYMNELYKVIKNVRPER